MSERFFDRVAGYPAGLGSYSNPPTAKRGASSRRTLVGLVATVAFVATVWAANATLERYGVVEVLGVSFASGVLWAGVAFGLRDVVHETLGRWWVAGAILVGSVLSWVVSDGATIPGGVTSIAVASGVAFLLSESADAFVYDPLRNRYWPAAVVGSNVVGAVVDSALFLWLAFGSIDLIAGQVVAKAAMVVVALPLVWWVRRRVVA